MGQQVKVQGMATDADSGQIVMDLGKLDRISAETNILHGDGFFPIPGYETQIANVTAGTGLKVNIGDYIAMIDGYIIFHNERKSLDFAHPISLNITMTGKFYILLKPNYSKSGITKPDKEEQKYIDNKGGMPQTGEGVLYLSATLSDDSIIVAEMNVPIGTTQIISGMINNGIKKFLYNIDDLQSEIKTIIETGIKGQGLFELENTVNIAKTNFKIDTYHNAASNDMYKGWIDAFIDNSGIDPASTGYSIVNNQVRPGGGLPSGLLAYYNMDEDSGVVIKDVSNNAYDGILYNAEWVAGKINSGVQFSGTNSYATLPKVAGLDIVDNFSLVFYIYPNSWSVGGNGAPGLITKRDAGNLDFELYYDVGNDKIAIYPMTDGSLLKSFAISASQWTHVVYTKAGSTHKFYKNGALVDTFTAPASYTTNSRICLAILGETFTNYCLNGILDEVAIFSKVLSAAEITNIYTSGIYTQPALPLVVTTKAHDLGIVPASALLTVVDSGDITYSISRDDGSTWTVITPDVLFTFTNEASGQNVRIKMSLAANTSYVDNIGLFIA